MKKRGISLDCMSVKQTLLAIFVLWLNLAHLVKNTDTKIMYIEEEEEVRLDISELYFTNNGLKSFVPPQFKTSYVKLSEPIRKLIGTTTLNPGLIGPMTVLSDKNNNAITYRAGT